LLARHLSNGLNIGKNPGSKLQKTIIMKTLIAAILFSSATILTAEAQTDRNQTPTKTPAQAQPQNSNRASDDNVRMHTDKMSKDLNLNEDQKKRLHEQNTTMYRDNQKLNQMTGEERSRMQKSQNDQYDKNLRGVLDENQYKTYETRRDAYRSEWNTTNQQPGRQGMEPAQQGTGGTGTEKPR